MTSSDVATSSELQMFRAIFKLIFFFSKSGEIIIYQIGKQFIIVKLRFFKLTF